MCSIIGVGGKLHKVLGLGQIGSSGERSLPFGLFFNILAATLNVACCRFLYIFSESEQNCFTKTSEKSDSAATKINKYKINVTQNWLKQPLSL